MILNVTLTNADTDYAVTIPACCEYVIKARDPAVVLKLRDVDGSGDYITYPANSARSRDAQTGRQFTQRTYYVQSPTAGAIVEVEYN